MSKNDTTIKDFFREMRNVDNQNPIPDFYIPQRKKSSFRKIYIISSTAAASILLLLVLYFSWGGNQNKSDPIELEITLTEREETNTQSLIKGEPSMYSWHPPSNSLIDNFNGW